MRFLAAKADHDWPWWVYVAFFVILLAFALLARNGDPQSIHRLLARDLPSRMVGLLGVAGGLGIGMLVLYPPTLAALDRERIVFFSRGAAGVSAAFVCLGLILLAAGKHWNKFVITPITPRPLTTTHWAATFLVASLCMAIGFAYEQIIAALGYVPLR